MENSLPKNMCQIGKTDCFRKIFVEDYVISFLKELLQGPEVGARLLAFYGDGFEENGTQFFLLKGMAVLPGKEEGEALWEKGARAGMLGKWEREYFSRIWRKYFSQWQAIGWYLLERKETDIVEIFSGMREQQLQDIRGYYIYYEKNEAMEEYLIHWHEERQETALQKRGGVKAEGKSRRLIKAEEPGGRKRALQETKKLPAKSFHMGKRFPVLAIQILNGISLMILILCSLIALTTINQYDKMKELEATVIYLEETLEQQKNLPEN